MKTKNFDSLYLTVTDTKKLTKNFITFFVLLIAVVVLLSIYVSYFPEEKAARFYVNGMVISMVGGPLIFLLYYYLFLSVKTKLTFYTNGVESDSGISILFSEIKDTSRIVNRHGYSSLFVIKLKNNKKYSFSPTNRFRADSDNSFNKFVELLERRAQENDLNTNTTLKR